MAEIRQLAVQRRCQDIRRQCRYIGCKLVLHLVPLELFLCSSQAVADAALVAL